jgi:hypothetical protein
MQSQVDDFAESIDTDDPVAGGRPRTLGKGFPGWAPMGPIYSIAPMPAAAAAVKLLVIVCPPEEP